MAKKGLFLVMACVLWFCLTACGGTSSAPAVPSSESATAQPTDAAEEGTAVQTAEKALVVYFSCTGNTERVAQEIERQTGADLYEIVPAEPYTEADLNYSDRTSRATVEQNDDSARPAIAGSIENIAAYDVIYVGYPIWWGSLPRILYTFFETYDVAGKTIAPFCTSGGSGLSGTADTIRDLAPEAVVLDGLSVRNASNAESEVTQWLAEIGLAQ